MAMPLASEERVLALTVLPGAAPIASERMTGNILATPSPVRNRPTTGIQGAAAIQYRLKPAAAIKMEVCDHLVRAVPQQHAASRQPPQDHPGQEQADRLGCHWLGQPGGVLEIIGRPEQHAVFDRIGKQDRYPKGPVQRGQAAAGRNSCSEGSPAWLTAGPLARLPRPMLKNKTTAATSGMASAKRQPSRV